MPGVGISPFQLTSAILEGGLGMLALLFNLPAEQRASGDNREGFVQLNGKVEQESAAPEGDSLVT